MDKRSTKIRTLGELKNSKYEAKPVKDEMRDNLIERIKKGKSLFTGIHGYDETVLPEIERAVLARHNINFLGLRGQAKTRMARSLVELLDEYIPVVEGSEIHDDPLNPISKYARDVVNDLGDNTPVEWVHRDERYTEKLATPDVTVADLIGDTDPIKAANLKLSYADERVIHFGLVPRAHRGIFVINELPDLQPRIQVALFNILQEGDIQIRGFKLRLPLDVHFIFTANPEDYTNRGAIITPLKDRIQSQILTHYPREREISRTITKQESNLTKNTSGSVEVPEIVADLLEQVAIEARQSEFVDQKSGVSARLTISAYELLHTAVERRLLNTGEKKGRARIGDLLSIIPAITGKIELVYEGEQEGAINVAHTLIGLAVRSTFVQYFPDPEMFKRKKEEKNRYAEIVEWFSSHDLSIPSDCDEKEFRKQLDSVKGLKSFVEHYQGKASEKDRYLFMEFVLHGMAEYSLLSKHLLDEGLSFGDILSSVFSQTDFDDEEDF